MAVGGQTFFKIGEADDARERGEGDRQR
jgi:hypothetical protein